METKKESKRENTSSKSTGKNHDKEELSNRFSRKIYDSQSRFFRDNQKLQDTFLAECSEAWSNYSDALARIQKKMHESLCEAYKQYLEVYGESLENPGKASEADKAYAKYVDLYCAGIHAPGLASQYEEIGKEITEQLSAVEKKMKSGYNKSCEEYLKDIHATWNEAYKGTLYPEDMWFLSYSMMNAAMLTFNRVVE